jgi:hypothetical protein
MKSPQRPPPPTCQAVNKSSRGKAVITDDGDLVKEALNKQSNGADLDENRGQQDAT